MIELDKFELELLDKVFHSETYENLKGEYSADEYILRDCIRSLARKKLIFILIPGEKEDQWKKSFLYDTDKLHHYKFQASAKGMDALSMAH